MTPKESRVVQADRLEWLNALYRGQRELAAARADGDPAAVKNARGRMREAAAEVREMTLTIEGRG